LVRLQQWKNELGVFDLRSIGDSNKDHSTGSLSPFGKDKLTKILVSRQEHTIFKLGPYQDNRIGYPALTFANPNNVVTPLAQSSDQQTWNVLVR